MFGYTQHVFNLSVWTSRGVGQQPGRHTVVEVTQNLAIVVFSVAARHQHRRDSLLFAPVVAQGVEPIVGNIHGVVCVGTRKHIVAVQLVGIAQKFLGGAELQLQVFPRLYKLLVRKGPEGGTTVLLEQLHVAGMKFEQ